MSKLIYFRQKSAATDFGCPDGEIESAGNAIVRPIFQTCPDNATEDNGEASGAPDDILADPNYHTRQLDTFASKAMPAVEFSLMPCTVAGWHNHPDNPPSAVVKAPKNPDADSWGSVAGDTLRKLEKDAARQHLFIEPFLALAAIRLADGKHTLPSSPVLLIPGTSAPVVEGSDNFTLQTMTLTIPLNVSRLRCRITSPEGSCGSDSGISGSEGSDSGFEDLMAQIAAIDIFISDPIPLYDHEEKLLPVHRAAGTSSPQSWVAAALNDDEFTAKLLSVDRFRMISSIPASKFYADQTITDPEGTNDYSDFFDVEFNIPSLPRETEATAYHPDFLQHSGISAATGCTLSGRTTLCDLTLTLPAIPHIATLMASSVPPSTAGTANPLAAEMEVIKNRQTLHSSRFSYGKVTESDFPKWLFLPEPDATRLTLVSEEATYIIPLRRHPLMNGAYYWHGSLKPSAIGESGVTILPGTLSGEITDNREILKRDTYRQPDAIRRSEKNSPFCFTDRLFYRLNTGRIIGMCRAFRASGLVATTSPTAYLFTATGIYLLKEIENGNSSGNSTANNNGELRDAGLIANYILDTPSSIIRHGKTLEFTTSAGVRMVISGTTVKPYTEGSSSSINSSNPGGSINISNPGGSLPKWQVKIEPEEPGAAVKIVTRPLKLDNLLPSSGPPQTADIPGLMSRIWSITLEGGFIREGITMSLYGSQDLISWKLLARSGAPHLRGLFTPGLRFARIEICGLLHGSLEALRLT